MKGCSTGYIALVMTSRNDSERPTARKPSSRNASERGNIVLVAALMVLSMGVTGVVVARLIQSRLTLDADLRLSNYAGMLAQYTAEGAINSLLYYWNTRQVAAGSRPSSYPNFPDIVATYSVPGGATFFATTACTYSVAISGTGPYTVVANATATSPGASPAWRTITRRVTVTVSSGSLYTVTGYSR